MKHSDLVVIIDNFYPDAESIRDRALMHEFSAPASLNRSESNRGPIANRTRCEPDLHNLLVLNIAPYVPKKLRSVNVEFRFTTQATVSKNICHADLTTYAGIVYLTPSHLCCGGTSFFRHIPSGDCLAAGDRGPYDWTDPDQWEEVYRAEMQFNRAVFYPGALFHAPTRPFFGGSANDGRLTQNFFIQT